MILDLLKQLTIGLWRYFSYRMRCLFGTSPAATDTQPDEERRPVEPVNHVSASFQAVNSLLTESYLEPRSLSTNRRDLEDSGLLGNPILQLWRESRPRAHKWSHYFETYQTIFSSRRSQTVRILEIGVYQGASLQLWRRYFDNPESVIVGIDIDPSCASFDSPQENIHVRIGSQDDAAFLQMITREFGPFDIIIDDGSHITGQMIASFNHLFAGALHDDGIYVAEDLHANYWAPYRNTRFTFLDLCKELIERMHTHYVHASLQDWQDDADSETGSLSLDLPAIATMVKEVRVFDSIVMIQKSRRPSLPRVLNPLAE